MRRSDPSCSAVCQGDAWHLLLRGLAGGKGSPESVRERPATFAVPHCTLVRARSTARAIAVPAVLVGTSRSALEHLIPLPGDDDWSALTSQKKEASDRVGH
jgi:hypothetical protein